MINRIEIKTNKINNINLLNSYFDNESYLIKHGSSEKTSKLQKKRKKASDDELIKINDEIKLIEKEENDKLLNLQNIFEKEQERITKQGSKVPRVESTNIKNERISKIKEVKEHYKKLIIEQKHNLRNYTESDLEFDIIKVNISNLKFNRKIEIENLNQEVKLTSFSKIINSISKGFVNTGLFFRKHWRNFKIKYPLITQFLVFFMISNGVTVLQLALMPLFKSIFNQTNLINISFQLGRIGNNFDGTPYYMFNYASGPIINGIGGGLAYFMAVQVTLAIAQIINFFTQRKITFKSDSNAWVAAGWYFMAYIAITFIAAAAQGFYKAPIYDLFMNTMSMGSTGELFADFITMIINSAISFWVFFPIFKVIFKQKETETK